MKRTHHHLCPTRKNGHDIQCVCTFIELVERHYEHGCELVRCEGAG